MELVLVGIHAIGHYSESEYIEEVLIKKETYEEIKEELHKKEFYIGDLDGKHSQVMANIYVEDIKNKYLSSRKNLKRDGETLINKIFDLCSKIGIDQYEEQEIITEFMRSVDGYVELNLDVKESQVKLITDFIKTLS